jgi:hypothetical protein
VTAATFPHPGRALWLPAFGAGALLAVVTSGGLLEDRLSAGSVPVGVVVNGLVTLAAIGALALVQRRAQPLFALIAPQLLGAACGVLGVHLALRVGWIAGAPWLSERPVQLVNDVASVLGTSMVVWACARGLDARWLAPALIVTAAYRATSGLWHVDMAPQGFIVPVQDLVAMQLVGVALALPAYRWTAWACRRGAV